MATTAVQPTAPSPSLCQIGPSGLILDERQQERALRVAALGRKNFLFVGTDEAGENLAGLYSLIATCEVNGVNPVAYLADVLLRVLTALIT